jgi:hypothetical protein
VYWEWGSVASSAYPGYVGQLAMLIGVCRNADLQLMVCLACVLPFVGYPQQLTLSHP